MTVTTDEKGRNNMWAKEPTMYISDSDAATAALETHADRAEKANGRWAMLGFWAAVGAYAFTGQIIPGVF
tara:strand:- start:239 stop:448 length:210 start_codon:yes stop_codon:yes gene_type:complete